MGGSWGERALIAGFLVEGWQRRPIQSGDGSLGSGKKLFFFFFSLGKIDVGMLLGHKEVIQGEENAKNGVTDGQVLRDHRIKRRGGLL